MPRTKGRHRKPRLPVVPTAALAGTGVAALVITIASGESPPEAGFVDARTIPSTINPTPTAAATIPASGRTAEEEHAARRSERVAQAVDAQDASPAASTDDGSSSGASGGGSAVDEGGSSGSQPPADEPSSPQPEDSPLPTTSPSPSPTEDGPLPKIPDLPLPDTPNLPGADLSVGVG